MMVLRVKTELSLDDELVHLTLNICSRLIKQLKQSTLNVYDLMACFILAIKLTYGLSQAEESMVNTRESEQAIES